MSKTYSSVEISAVMRRESRSSSCARFKFMGRQVRAGVAASTARKILALIMHVTLVSCLHFDIALYKVFPCPLR
jgi:hypothetical protein